MCPQNLLPRAPYGPTLSVQWRTTQPSTAHSLQRPTSSNGTLFQRSTAFNGPQPQRPTSSNGTASNGLQPQTAHSQGEGKGYIEVGKGMARGMALFYADVLSEPKVIKISR